MTFKYFRDPKAFGGLLDERCNCSICGYKEKCFDGESFYGETLVDAVCFKCLRDGKLEGTGVFANDADVEGLYNQMIELYPDKPKAELLAEAKAKINELEMRTPPVLSWQDWKYPALDGDFCEFISFVSKEELNALAEDGDGKQFLIKHLKIDEDNLINPEIVWYQLSDTKITKIEQSNQQCLCYLFKSKTTDKYLMIWDVL